VKVLKFRLYITGESAQSKKAKSQVSKLLEEIFLNTNIKTELEIIDVLNKDVNDEQWLVVTPMLAKLFPEPEKRVFGDFSDSEKILKLLGLNELNK